MYCHAVKLILHPWESSTPLHRLSHCPISLRMILNLLNSADPFYKMNLHYFFFTFLWTVTSIILITYILYLSKLYIIGYSFLLISFFDDSKLCLSDIFYHIIIYRLNFLFHIPWVFAPQSQRTWICSVYSWECSCAAHPFLKYGIVESEGSQPSSIPFHLSEHLLILLLFLVWQENWLVHIVQIIFWRILLLLHHRWRSYFVDQWNKGDIWITLWTNNIILLEITLITN